MNGRQERDVHHRGHRGAQRKIQSYLSSVSSVVNLSYPPSTENLL
jgi:hypothetical protein